MLKATNVSKKFGQVVAVDNLSFSVSRGEVVGLLGPNGAGKTTTMRLITSFLYSDSGEITIAGDDTQQNSVETRKKIGYLPENNPLYEDFLVCDFLQFYAELKEIPKNAWKNAIDSVTASTGLEKVFYRPINTLSKGFKQRVGLAQALLHKPDILILDEPTQGLDPNQQEEIRKLITNLGGQKTVILSTHIMQEVTAVCDRVLIINEGKLVADGTTKELAQKLGRGRVLCLDIEGSDITHALKDIHGVISVEEKGQTGPCIHLELSLEKDIKIQPIISSLVKKHDWVIWKLHEVEHNLEDVFKKLTGK